MKITFKDVGQGDSIILEWLDNDIPKIGIIDCNRKNRKNPVLEYVRDSGYKEIQFIILSHPHSDHYSGMTELLNFCHEKKPNPIIIHEFSHTLHFLGADYYRYLNWVEIDTAALVDLRKLIDTCDSLLKMGTIRKIGAVLENWRIELTDAAYLKCLSPSLIESEEYMKIVRFEPEKNKKAASRAANYLSTLFKLTVNDSYYLLTSDSEVLTFERLIRQNSHRNLKNKNLSICQLPHHGSLKNYCPEFWDGISVEDQRTAVVSAGFNEKYKHPHIDVLKGFHKKGYEVVSTNIVYGMTAYVDYLQKIAETSSKLDTFSELINTSTSGDKTFRLY